MTETLSRRHDSIDSQFFSSVSTRDGPAVEHVWVGDETDKVKPMEAKMKCADTSFHGVPKQCTCSNSFVFMFSNHT